MSEHGLELLLGGYFHMDWRYEYSSHEEAIRSFVAENPKSESVDVVADLRRLIDSTSEKTLRKKFAYTIGNDFAKNFQHPRWKNALLWFQEQIVAILEEGVISRGDGESK